MVNFDREFPGVRHCEKLSAIKPSQGKSDELNRAHAVEGHLSLVKAHAFTPLIDTNPDVALETQEITERRFALRRRVAVFDQHCGAQFARTRQKLIVCVYLMTNGG